MTDYARMEPLSLRRRVLERTGDAALADAVYHIANSERMYRRQVTDLQAVNERLRAQLPQQEAVPRQRHSCKPPPEADG